MNKCEFCDVEHDVMVPCIHLNGTSAGELAERYSRMVMFQHEQRCDKLNDVLKELNEIRDHVHRVIDFREEERARRRTQREEKK